MKFFLSDNADDRRVKTLKADPVDGSAVTLTVTLHASCHCQLGTSILETNACRAARHAALANPTHT